MNMKYPKNQYEGQRIGVFVDVQNMYYSARNLYNSKVNFSEILKKARGNRSLIRAIAYVIRADVKDEKNFFDALEMIGYEIRVKDLQTFVGGAKKGDWDIGIAMDAIELAPKLDTIVLISGDGDFVPLVEHLRRALGCKVEVCAFGKTTSAKLKEEADVFVDLDMEAGRYLISASHPSRAQHRIDPSHPQEGHGHQEYVQQTHIVANKGRKHV